MAGYSFGNGLTLDPGEGIQQGIAQGRQTALSRLLGQAYGDSTNRDDLLKQAAMIDPGKAMQAQQAFQGQDDDTLARFVKRASLASNAWQSGNKELAQSVYSSIVPDAAKLFPGFQPPAQMDDKAAQAFAQLAGQTQAEQFTLSPGSARYDATGKQIASQPFSPPGSKAPTYVDVPDGQGGTVKMQYDPASGGLVPLQLGGPQSAADPGMGPGPATQAVSGQPFYDSVLASISPLGGILGSTTGGQHNVGSLHPQGRAVDIPLGASASPQAKANAAQMVAALKAQGLTVRDERTRPAGQAVWDGPHLHVEAPGGNGAPRIGYTPPKAGKGENAPSGYRFTADGARLEPIPGGPADTGGDYQLSSEAVSNAAWDFIMTGTKPQFARSHEGDKQRIAIQNEVAKIAKQAGVTPQELSTQKGKYKALQTSLANTQKMSDTMDRQTETFHRNADYMLKLSASVPRTNMPALNKYLLDFNQQWKGDPATAAYIAAARTAINEYAKVASGAMGSAGSTDTARREAQEAISAAQSPQQLARVIDTLKRDAENQRNATHDQLIGISARMAQFGNQGPAAANHDPLGILGK